MAPETSLPQADQHPRSVNLFALAGRGAPRLRELENLPEGYKLIGVGRPGIEVAGTCLLMPRVHARAAKQYKGTAVMTADWTPSDWSKVEVIFKCGTERTLPRSSSYR